MGLGNPGKSYDKTRHNVGKMFLEHVFESEGAKKWLQASYGSYFETNEAIYIRTNCYMNVSAKCLKSFMKEHKMSLEDLKPRLLVVCDDLEQANGAVKLKDTGSAKGHNGVKSMLGLFDEDPRQFARLLIGVGRPAERSSLAVGNWVLGEFTEPELKSLASVSWKKASILLNQFVQADVNIVK